MRARLARKILNHSRTAEPERKPWKIGTRRSTWTRALARYRRAVRQIRRSDNPPGWDGSKKAYRWAWQLRVTARANGLQPGRLAWIRSQRALAAAVEAHYAQGPYSRWWRGKMTSKSVAEKLARSFAAKGKVRP